MFIFFLLLFLSASSSIFCCSCNDSSRCGPLTAHLFVKKKMKRVASIEGPPLIELTLQLSVKGIPSKDLASLDLMKNESSFTIDWLPMSHDVIEESRKPPLLKEVHFRHNPTELHIVSTFLFDEVNMRLRSMYEIRMHALYHRDCHRMIPLFPSPALNVTFACERIAAASCAQSIRADHQPVCNLLWRSNHQIFESDKLREAAVQIKLEDKNLEKIKYLVIYYGACETPSARPVGPDCVLNLDSSEKQRVCIPSEPACNHSGTLNISISPLLDKRYGVQICGVLDRRFEIPPLVGRASRVAAESLPLVIPQHSTALSSSLAKTVLGYAILLGSLVLFLLAILIYKCATGRVLFHTEEKELDVWELEEQHLNVQYDKSLGSGSFGKVYLGYLDPEFRSPAQGPIILDDQHRVAVKIGTRSDRVGRKLLADEIQGAKTVGRHPRLANLIGTLNTPEAVMYVLEICRNDTLQFYLSYRRRYMTKLQNEGVDLNGFLVNVEAIDFDLVISTHDIHRLASQICAGMSYLSSQGIVHNSLCAKHILIGSDHSAKISDFAYVQKEPVLTKIAIPENMYKWASIELLAGEEVTCRSDCWSFGVVLWELTTLGGSPYHGIQNDNMLGLIQKGFRLQKPEHCSDEIYQLMRICWNEEVVMRPTFADLTERIAALIENEEHNKSSFLMIDSNRDMYTPEPTILNKKKLSRIDEMNDDARSDRLEEERRSVLGSRKPSADERNRKPSGEAAKLLSESERLLGFRE